jgi:hypothetical protein
MTPFNPHCRILVAGNELDSWRHPSLFKSVDVILSTGDASECAWSIFDPDFKFLNQWVTEDGISVSDVKVWLGFGADLGVPIFEGLLASPEWEEETTTFRFFDRGCLMRQVQQTEYHRGLDDVGIIAKLAKQSGLGFEGPTPPIKLPKHKSIIQDSQTDWEHAEERAQDVGLALYVRRNTLYAKEAAKKSEPVVSLIYRKDPILEAVFRYRAPENQEGRSSKVEFRARGSGGKRLSGTSSTHRRGTTRVEIKNDLAVKSKSYADRRAQARKDLQREHAFTGTIVFVPDFKKARPDIRDTVQILNIGKFFSGEYICDQVNHSFAPGQLQTTLELYRDIKTV